MLKTTVFKEKTDNYHTFRIPSIICTSKGTLLAFAEGRASRKDAAENDIVLKKSEDNGESWGEIRVIASEENDSLNNPQPVIEEESGRIWLTYQRTPYPYRERDVSEGLEGEKVSHTYLIFSDNDGESWSIPKKITSWVKRPTVATTTAGGPGFGIQIKHGRYKGRLIQPFNQGPWRQWTVYAVYSDDKGETWQYGNAGKGRGNEVQMVELSDGSIMLNARTYGKTFITKNKTRMVGISTDGGENWSVLKKDPVLIEPNCQGSIIRYNFPEDDNEGKSRIIFSNPASKVKRRNGTIRLSYDEGKSWAISKVICSGKFAYSCLVILKNGEIGCLYETGENNAYERLEFVKFPLEWLES